MKRSKTERGFTRIEFIDRSNVKCSIEKSSLATEDAICLGVDYPDPKIFCIGEGWVNYPIPENVLISTSMHLTVDQVKQLLPILQKFVDTGEI